MGTASAENVRALIWNDAAVQARLDDRRVVPAPDWMGQHLVDEKRCLGQDDAFIPDTDVNSAHK